MHTQFESYCVGYSLPDSSHGVKDNNLSRATPGTLRRCKNKNIQSLFSLRTSRGKKQCPVFACSAYNGNVDVRMSLFRENFKNVHHSREIFVPSLGLDKCHSRDLRVTSLISSLLRQLVVVRTLFHITKHHHLVPI